MENPNLIFFGDAGLTSTSANHVANLAKEYVQNIETELANCSFYRESVALIGTKDFNILSEGMDDEAVKKIPNLLQKVSEANSLIAWLREAIKAKKTLTEQVDSMSMEMWAVTNNIVLPVKPNKRASITSDQVLAKRSIKERNRFYTLQAQAAVYGKYIHPDGKFATARKRFLHKMQNRHDIVGSGRDALLYNFDPTCDAETIEHVFFDLQTIHRGVQAELNGIQHSIDEEVRADQIQAQKEYMVAFSEYSLEQQRFVNQYEEYKQTEIERIANRYKIVIPHDLQSIYNEINSLGK